MSEPPPSVTAASSPSPAAQSPFPAAASPSPSAQPHISSPVVQSPRSATPSEALDYGFSPEPLSSGREGDAILGSPVLRDKVRPASSQEDGTDAAVVCGRHHGAAPGFTLSIN